MPVQNPIYAWLDENKPLFDQVQADKLNKMARVNALAEAFRVLGDTVTASNKGVVTPRQDKVTPYVLSKYDELYKKNLADQDRWDNIRLGAMNSDYNFERNKELRDQTMQFQADQAQKNRDFQKGMYDYRLKNNVLSSLAKRKNPTDQTKGLFDLYDPETGEKLWITQGAMNDIMAKISQDPELNKDIKAMQAQFGPINSETAVKQFVAQYWKKFAPEVRRMAVRIDKMNPSQQQSFQPGTNWLPGVMDQMFGNQGQQSTTPTDEDAQTLIKLLLEDLSQ